VTGAAAVLAASPVAGRRREFPGVLAGIALDGPAARLAGMLDRHFCRSGWDPVSRVLSCLPAPAAGTHAVPADGCPATMHGTQAGGLCWSCFARLRRAGLSIEEIAASPQVPRAAPSGRCWCRGASGCRRADGRGSGPACAWRTRAGSAASQG